MLSLVFSESQTRSAPVLYKRDNGSVVELARFTLNSFEFDDQDVAEFFGMELARLVVDTSHHELLIKRRGR